MPPTDTFTWKAREHSHIERSADWFWALGIIAVSGAIAAIIFGNLLFAILILLIAFLLAMFASKKPELHTFRVDKRGIAIDKTLYPFRSFEAFWIAEHDDEDDLPAQAGDTEPRLILQANRGLFPYIIIPLTADISPEALRDYLNDVIDEEELHEPLSQKILELVGF